MRNAPNFQSKHPFHLKKNRILLQRLSGRGSPQPPNCRTLTICHVRFPAPSSFDREGQNQHRDERRKQERQRLCGARNHNRRRLTSSNSVSFFHKTKDRSSTSLQLLSTSFYLTDSTFMYGEDAQQLLPPLPSAHSRRLLARSCPRTAVQGCRSFLYSRRLRWLGHVRRKDDGRIPN